MWSKKWYLKRNISCDAHLLSELLETDVPWDYAIVVSAGKLRKLWDSLSEMCSSVCERRLKRTVLRPALLPVKTSQFTQFFHQVWRHTVKSLSLTEGISLFRHMLYPLSRFKGWIFYGKRRKGLQDSTVKSWRSALQFSVRSWTTVNDGFHFYLSTSRITVGLYVNL